jgi:exodeoxyribonuclease VII large subunit
MSFDLHSSNLPPGTYTVAELGAELQSALSQIFTGVWLVGEVQRPRLSRPGHLYLELVEKGSGDALKGAFGAVVFRQDLQRIQRQLRRHGLEIAEGQQLRCYAEISFYPPHGRLQLVLRDIDAVFALGDLERRRQETLEYLQCEGLMERNRSLELALLPLRIGLVTSSGSAAAEDFLATLRSSGLPFEVGLAAATVQGARAEQEVTAALQKLSSDHLSGRRTLDLLVLIRGGGSRSDLAAFDARRVAEAIARAPLPVLTGLGHEIDVSVADRVAHTARKTPTSVAEFLVRRCLDVVERVDEVQRGLQRGASVRIDRHWQRMQHGSVRLQRQAGALDRSFDRIMALSESLQRAASRALVSSERNASDLAERALVPAHRRLRTARTLLGDLRHDLVRSTERRMQIASEALESRQRLTAQLDPVRVLARGFSVTRGPTGRALRSSADARPGEIVFTQLAEGSLRSIVEQSAAE